MFIVQTYFSDDIAGRAKAYVYYVELPGNPVELRDVVRTSFRELGQEYGPDVSLLFPDLGSVAKIRAELKRELDQFFGIKGRETPCLVISPTVIGNTAGRDDWLYFSLLDRPGISSDEINSAVRDCVEAIMAGAKVEKNGILRRLWYSVEAKPGIAGFRLDLRKFFGV